MESCLMASNGFPPGMILGFHSEHGSSRISDDFNHFIPYNGSNQDLTNPLSFNLSLHQKDEWRPTGGLLDTNHLVRIDSMCKRSPGTDFQDARPDSVVFGNGIVNRFARHEQVLKLLASGSIEEDDPLLDLSMLYDLAGPQSPISDFPQNLVYPTKELYFKEPFLDLVGDGSSCPERAYHPDGQLPYNYYGTEMNDVLSAISDFHSSTNANRSSRLTMLVPYFERRRRASVRTAVSTLATEKVGSLKSHDKSKEKTSQKKKKTSTRADAYSNSYLHACESLLSIIASRKQHDKNAIHSLKKSGPHLPRLLTQFSASIAGTGIAVVLSVLCRVACTRVPFCASKILSTGFGLGLVWLSWSVNRLRDTIICISKSHGKLGERDDEMMNRLDRNLGEILFRAAALMAVVVLKVA